VIYSAYYTHIEVSFQRQLNTGVVFDWDCVERRNYVEVYEDCAKISNLHNNMLSNRFFQRKSEQQMASIKQWFTTRQLFSSDIIHISDLPSSSLNLFEYAKDIMLTHQARKFEDRKIHLEEGLEALSRFFHQWRLRPNPSKIKSVCFTWEHMMPTESWLSSLTTH
jgi:hypothetical protein